MSYADLEKKQNLYSKISNISLVLLFLILNTIKILFFRYYITFQCTNIKIIVFSTVTTFLVLAVIFIFLLSRNHRAPLLVFYILQSLYLSINMIYFFYFSKYLFFSQAFSLFTIGAETALKSGFYIDWKMLIIIIDLPIFLLLCLKYNSYTYLLRKGKLKLAIYMVSCVILLISYMYTSHEIGQPFSMKMNRFGDVTIVKYYGLLTASFNNMIQTNSTPLENKPVYSEQSVFAKKDFSQKNNFILIQLESIDSNIVDFKYKGEYVTPFLQSLSKSSIYYPYVLSYHKAGGTVDAEISILESIEPLTNFPSSTLSAYTFPNSFVKVLASEGYTTQAFHGNTSDFWNRNMLYPALGYNKFLGRMEMNLKEEGWGASDNSVFNFVKDDLESQSAPFLYHIITMSSHDPFKNVSKYYKTNMFDSISNTRVRNFLTSVSYVDKQLEIFLSSISIPKNTYIIIHGDHTPSIGSNNLYQEASIIMNDEKLEFVPLFIITPEKTVYAEQADIASFLDIAPTILHASDLSFQIQSEGANLQDPKAERRFIPLNKGLYDRKELFLKINQK